MFLVNGRWFKTLCKTVLSADTFDVSISTEKHNIHACISDKCYFLSIDNYSFENDETLKTDFYFKRDFKNIKEFITKLDDVLPTFIATSIADKDFYGNIDECITKILDSIKESKRETEVRVKRKPITSDIDMKEMFTEERATVKSHLNSVYGITAERETATEHTYEIRVFKDGAYIRTFTFSLESSAEYAFTILESNAIVFPKPCFKMIELFKDGKFVKMSEIYFGKIALEVNNNG